MAKFVPLSGVNVRRVLGLNNEVTVGSATITIRDANTGMLKPLRTNAIGSDPIRNPFKSEPNGSWVVYTTSGPTEVIVTKGHATGILMTMVAYEPLVIAESNPYAVHQPDFIGQQWLNPAEERLFLGFGLDKRDWLELAVNPNGALN